MAKILIAEDDRNMRQLLEAVLSKSGYHLEFAENGAEALEKARLSPPDLIISDVMMPEMDGFMFCKSVKADPRLKNIPFLLYTATNSEKDEAALALKIGAARFIPKPGDIKDLVKAVAEELAKVQAAPAPEPDERPGRAAEADTEYLLVLLRKLRAREQELEQARAGLQESEERLKKAQAMAHVGNWEIDLLSQTLNASEEVFRIYGLAYEPAGLPLAAAQAAVLTEHRAALDFALTRLITKRGGYNEEFRIARAGTGEIRHILSKAELICAPDGRPLRVTGVLQDITERKLAQEGLRQAQKLDSIGQLSGGIAHDLNNLLGPILGYADFLRKSIEPGDQRLADIEEIVKAADRAAGLVRQLLAFSRRQVLEPKVVKLNDIVSEMGRMLQRVIGERLRLNLVLGQEAGLVKVDPGQINQVLLNLALNARDAMANDGEVCIETYSLELALPSPSVAGTLLPGKYSVLAVKDFGCGMDETVKSRIFEPFFTTKEPGKGTGLGLASVYGIVKQSGGEIQVESEPGKGAIFRIYLPLSSEHAQAPVLPAPAVAPGKGLVMLVEDDDAMRRIARRMLTAGGYTVLEAVNGKEALKLLTGLAEPAALLLTDLAMPEMDGIELSLEVDKRWPNTKILCMSGYGGKEEEFRKVLGSKAEFIEKPFSPDALTRKVGELLDRGR